MGWDFLCPFGLERIQNFYFFRAFYEVTSMTAEADKPNIITASLDFLVNWGRTNSLWPFPYGTACCAIEFMSTEVGRYDLSRIGSEYVRLLRASPTCCLSRVRLPISRLRS